MARLRSLTTRNSLLFCDSTSHPGQDRAELDAAHNDQRAAIANLEDADLQKVVGNGMRMDEFLAMVIRHDTWHAGQTALARRLWRTK